MSTPELSPLSKAVDQFAVVGAESIPVDTKTQAKMDAVVKQWRGQKRV